MKASTFLWIGLGTMAVGAGAFFLYKQIQAAGGSTVRAITQEEGEAMAAKLPSLIAQKGVDMSPKTFTTTREELMNRIGMGELGYSLI